MRDATRPWLALASLLVLPLACCPDASPGQEPRAPSGTNAARAGAAVHVLGEPVVDLLKTLSKQSELSLSAASPLDERRVHALIDDLPLARVRAALADVVSGLWVRKQEGKRLLMQLDPAAARERDRLLAQRRAQFEPRIREMIRDLSLDADGLERLRTQDPDTWTQLTAPPVRPSLQVASLLGNEQWQQLMGNGSFSISGDQLGPQGGSWVRDLAEQINRSGSPDAPPGTYDTVDPEEAARGGVTFNVGADVYGEPFGTLGIVLKGKYGPCAGYLSASRPLSGPSTRWPGGSGSQANASSSKEPLTLTFKEPPRDWGAALRAASEQLHIQAVSEEFTRLQPPLLFGPSAQKITGTLPEILDRLCQVFHYQWRQKDGVYQFRSMAWYWDRELEPPGTLVKAVYTAREAKQPLALEWLERAAALAPPAQERLLRHAPQAARTVRASQAVLIFYAGLTAAQRTALTSPQGLTPEQLAPAQRDSLAAAVAAVARDWPPDAAASARATLAEERGTARFTFAAGGPSVVADILLPSAEPFTRVRPPQ